VAKGGKIIFVGTKRQAQEAVKMESDRCGMYCVTNRWMGGTLTNFQTIRKSIDRLKKLESMFEDGTVNRFLKKEILNFQREVDKLRNALGGIKEMEALPQLAFIVDPKREEIAVKECRKLHIPIAAIVDSNCDPDLIDYIIPGNDDAIRAIKLFVSHVADACLEGQAMLKDRSGESVKKLGEEEKPAPVAKAEEERSAESEESVGSDE